jgi:hypothetical protein
MNMKTLSYSDVPKKWAVCFQNDCPMKEECLRWKAAQVVPEKVQTLMCVTPYTRKGNECPCFASAEPVRLAWGMTKLFANVPWYMVKVLREEMFPIFGSRRQFYRYRLGRWVISPEQQRQVAQVFRNYGFEDEPEFDVTKEGFDFV